MSNGWPNAGGEGYVYSEELMATLKANNSRLALP